MQKRWQLKDVSDKTIDQYAETAKVSRHVARLLYNRNIPAEAAQSFLAADYADLSDPSALYNLDPAVDLIGRAIDENRPMVVYGDYDVDGMSAATLLSEALRSLGGQVSVYIPSRLEEGYGLNPEAVKRIFSAEDPLLITVDTGIAAADVLAPFIAEGRDIIVTDHHMLPEKLPDCLIINPKFHPETEAFGQLCGAGVAFMLACGLFRRAGRPTWDLDAYVALAALATVADIVPLLGDNRRIVKRGLTVLNHQPRPGIAALMEAAHLTPGKLRAEHIAFQLAPRLNAAGRLDKTDLALALLRADNSARAREAAGALDDLNRERKAMEEQAFQAALTQITELAPKSIVVCGDDWHAGVIGIVASRLMERYGVPAVVLTLKQEEGSLTGSARAPEGFDLYAHLSAVQPTLVQFGGHAKAAGLTVAQDKLADFRAAFQEECVKSAQAWYGKDTLRMDAILQPADIDEDLWQALEALEPTGCGNPVPTFAFVGQNEVHARPCGKDGAHLQLLLPAPQGDIRGIAFRRGPDAQGCSSRPQDILFNVNRSTFRGQDRLELMVRDIRPAFLADDPLDDLLYLHGEAHLQEKPYADIGEARTFYTKVAGVSFDDRQAILSQLKAPQRLTLQPEPENPHDVNALALLASEGKIGYLNRDLAAVLAPLIRAGRRYAVDLTAVTGSGESLYGANIKLTWMDEATADQAAGLSKPGRPMGALEAASALLDGRPLFPAQEKALEALADGSDLTLIMATGRGKSLVYRAQAAAKALQDGAMTVVFFPLKALLKDQYRSLSTAMAPFGISVYEAYGDLSGRRRIDLFGALADGRADIVLTTPEFFLAHEKAFTQGSKPIGFWVLDEAHHLQDRRAGYRHLKNYLADAPGQVLALTATLPDAAAAACRELRPQMQFMADRAPRTNLQLVDRRGIGQKNRYLLRLALSGQKTLCYVNSRKQALEIAKKLRLNLPYSLRHTVGYYHGGLNRKAREWLQGEFEKGNLRLLVATTAFGEGINLPDVRHVVLYHLCFSKEAFNQLAGRAGRDGQEAYIHLIYGERDQAVNELILSRTCPNRSTLGNVYQLICRRLRKGPDKLRGDLLQAAPGEDFSYETLRLSKRIFGELGLLDRREADGRYSLAAVEEKKSLTDSATYQEVANERKDYDIYLATAFDKDLANLSAQVQSPVLPNATYFEGGGPDD